MKVQSNVTLSGKYKFLITNTRNNTTRVVDWFSNLITNQGLDKIGEGVSNLLDNCRVGTGSSAPTEVDTGLESPLGNFVSAKIEDDVFGSLNVTPYYGWVRRQYVFPANTIVGNLTEISINWGSSNSTAFSRSLIKENDNPITLTILEDEILTVVYELRLVPNLEDVNRTISVNNTAHNIITRAALLGNPSHWGNKLGIDSIESGMSNQTGLTYYNGYIGSKFEQPNGSSASPLLTSPEMVAIPYVLGTYYKDYIFSCNAASCNLEGGIRSIMWNLGGGHGKYQSQFDPPLPKSLEMTLKLTMRISWGR